MSERRTPNPNSKILSDYSVCGTWLGYVPQTNVEANMAYVLLYVDDSLFKNGRLNEVDLTVISKAIIGGAGLGMTCNLEVPDGKGAILISTSVMNILGKNIFEIQKDLGLPWHVEDGESHWFE